MTCNEMRRELCMVDWKCFELSHELLQNIILQIASKGSGNPEIISFQTASLPIGV
jgi:hypothetical protein